MGHKVSLKLETTEDELKVLMESSPSQGLHVKLQLKHPITLTLGGCSGNMQSGDTIRTPNQTVQSALFM